MVIIAGYALYTDRKQRDANVKAFRDLVERARAFEGNIGFAISADSVDPRRSNLLEVWESADALDAWRAKAKGPRTGIKPTERRMRRFDAEDGGPLF